MLTLLAAASEPAGGGAPLGELAIIAGGTTLLTAVTVWLCWAYRRGGARALRRAEAAVERAIGVPGWAALPGAGAVVCATLIILGATWDIGLHIDVGRDEGPLGTAAHYPLLFGLLGAFLMGVLAVGMAPSDPRRSSPVAYRLPGVGALPAAAVLLFAGASFGMLAFPLDDIWHRIFGQDVTLWGPTHIMIIGGTLTAGIGGVLLLVEGARAGGHNPFGGRSPLRRPLPLLLGAVFLYLWAATVHEFNWGVPQFRQVWHPLLLAFGGAQALVLARLLGGRGGALGALALWLPLQIAMTLAIGGPLEVTAPAFPLFAAAALIVEALGLRGEPSRPVRFGAVAGLAVGTIGFAAEYGWSHVAMPLPWEPALLTEGLPTAIVAGVAGGVLSGLMAQALTGTLARGRGPLVTASLAAAAFIGLGINAAIVTTPDGVRATMELSDVRRAVPPGGDEPVRVADLTVRLNRPEVADDALWVYVLGWQGGGRSLDHLTPRSDASWRSTEPVPVGGTWKTFVRIHTGRSMLAAPLRMAPDPAIGFAGVPAEASVARPMVFDQELMQIERKADAPMWLWKPLTVLVLSLVGAILMLLAGISVRLGRLAAPAADHRSGRGKAVARKNATPNAIRHERSRRATA